MRELAALVDGCAGVRADRWPGPMALVALGELAVRVAALDVLAEVATHRRGSYERRMGLGGHAIVGVAGTVTEFDGQRAALMARRGDVRR